MNFYIADWHYGHENCIHFDNRPFDNVKDMNTQLIKNWQQRVTDKDTVYILGDMFWSRSEQEIIGVLDKLPGKKVLILGNHDDIVLKRPLIRKKFEYISDYLEIEDNGKNIVLCHYPIHCFRNHYYGWYHLYGHVHTSKEYTFVEEMREKMISDLKWDCNMYNVGVMLPYMDYTPRTLDEILERNKSND